VQSTLTALDLTQHFFVGTFIMLISANFEKHHLPYISDVISDLSYGDRPKTDVFFLPSFLL